MFGRHNDSVSATNAAGTTGNAPDLFRCVVFLVIWLSALLNDADSRICNGKIVVNRTIGFAQRGVNIHMTANLRDL
jgi:hypothetical protein